MIVTVRAKHIGNSVAAIFVHYYAPVDLNAHHQLEDIIIWQWRDGHWTLNHHPQPR